MAHITSMPLVARTFGTARVTVGLGIPHPVGDPTVAPLEEAKIRDRVVDRALHTLTSAVPSNEGGEADGGDL